MTALRSLLKELDLWQLPRYVMGSSAGSMVSIYLASRMQFQVRLQHPRRDLWQQLHFVVGSSASSMVGTILASRLQSQVRTK